MSKIRKKKIKKTNILLGFICILLAVLLGFILVTSYKSEQKESRHLSEIADDQQSGIEDYEAVKERAKELEEVSSEEAEDTEDIKSKNTEDTKDTEKTDTADTEDTKDKTTAASGIVCWGDDLINGEESNTYSYMTVLQKLLTDNGYNMTVINKTLQGGGTLSMMKMAGVSDETIQSYITKHQQAANGAQLNVTETGIRDLTEEQTTRNDMDCIPVIFMGYYGGWNHDPAELADQQELIRAGVLPEDYDFEAHKELVPMQPGDVPVTYADTTALEEDFGFRPSTSLREGLRKFAGWYREFYM